MDQYKFINLLIRLLYLTHSFNQFLDRLIKVLYTVVQLDCSPMLDYNIVSEISVRLHLSIDKVTKLKSDLMLITKASLGFSAKRLHGMCGGNFVIFA